MSFNDKVVIVTGGSSGIGAAIAIKFSSEGAKVAIVGRNEKKLKNVSEICEKSGNKPMIIVADVSKENDLKRIITDTLGRFGKLDVLVNNAGIGGNADIGAEYAMQVFDKVFATNLHAVAHLTHLAASHLIATKGNIINISSIASMSVMSPSAFIYSSSKAALDHFTRCVALELAPKGVRVNAVNPGPVKSDILENMGISETHEGAIWDLMKKATVLDRISDPEETADVVLFLASDKAKCITGACYVTDNGALLKVKQPEILLNSN